MNRTRLLFVAGFVSVALLVPTGAVPLFDGGPADQVSEDLVMAPADGPNGAYAVLNEEDEIELRLTEANRAVAGDGIGSHTLTRIPGVFTISYTGEEYARVWLTDGVEDVTFVGGVGEAGTTDSLEGRENAVVLGPNQTVVVGLLVDTRGDHDVESAREFTVHAEVADTETPTVAGGGEKEGPSNIVTTPTTEATRTEEPPTVEPETTGSTDTETAGAPTDAPPGTQTAPRDSATDDGPLTVPPETTGRPPLQVAEAGGESPGVAGIPGTVASGVAALAVLLLLGAWRLVQ